MIDDTLSVCIIVKNEEKNLGRCIGSLEHIADEFIVVDTGSTDNTIKIAKGFGAKVYEMPWENNFSAARNAALDKATKNWIFYIDADEVMDFTDGYALKEILGKDYKDGEAEGFCLKLVNVVDNKKTLSCASLRIIRNRPEYRFKGRIHEQIYPPMRAKFGDNCVQVLDLVFYHYGYDCNESDIASKSKRNLEIFSSYEESEKDAFFYYNLGNEHLRIGNIKEALENYILSDTTEGEDNGFRIFLPVYIVKAYYDIKEYDKAIEFGKKTLESYPNYKDLHFVLAACYYDSGRYKEALQSLLNYKLFSQTDYGYPEFHLNMCNDIDKLIKELNEKISSI